MNLEFFVANRKLTAKGYAALTADTAQCDTFTIDFDREWDGLVKVVTLENGDNTVQVLYTGKTPLPRQVCGRGDLRLLCCGYRSKGDSVAVVRTFPMIRPVRMVGAAAAVTDTAQPEAASLYEQLMAAAARAEAAAQSARDISALLKRKLEEGAFMGQPGPAGAAATITLAPVLQADTPLVENIGTDRNACLRFTLPGKYVMTAQDKQDIALLVDEALTALIGSGVLT